MNFDRSSSTQSQRPFEEWMSEEQMVQYKINGDSRARNPSYIVYRYHQENSRKGRQLSLGTTSCDRLLPIDRVDVRILHFTFNVNISVP